jgi:chromosome segregation ATPase
MLDLRTLDRVKAVIGGEPTTESELRTLAEAAEAWARTLEAQLSASERRLQRLDREPAPALTEISREARRIEGLRSQLLEGRQRLSELQRRAQELRATWLLASNTRRRVDP